MKPILEVQHIYKRFALGVKQESYLSLRDAIMRPFAKRASSDKTFLALDDVSFNVYPGQSIGIIGRNGAGKSTLLKILSRITPPTSGKVISRGRIASLLEVGTGFHPELTGRENIYMNGSILGMRKAEINKHFDEIVDFSGVEKFLDTPLKRYSSGMQLRLAFSVAAHLEPEVLVIDEVLAVGDAEFQKKCLGKMDQVSKSGRTVLFVSHDMNAIEQLCSRAIILQKGALLQDGDAGTLIGAYLSANKNFNVNELNLTHDVQLKELAFESNEIPSGGDLRFAVKIAYAGEKPLLSDFSLLIYSLKGARVGIVDLRPYIDKFRQQDNMLILNAVIENLNLIEGEYSIGLFCVLNGVVKEFMDISQIRIKALVNPDAKVNPYQSQYRGYIELVNNIKTD